MKTIHVTVSPDGGIQVETKGFAGASCRTASEFLEKALGKKTGAQLTEEFFHSTTQTQSLQEGA